MNDGAVISVSGLEVAYDDKVVLDGIDLEVSRGEILVILGGSGCGKTTLLKAIIGLIESRAGELTVLGETLRELGEAERERLQRRIGVMFQYGALLNSLTAGENVALPLEMHSDLGRDLIESIVRTRLELVGLGQAHDLDIDQLSGGMRKRVALARAMALDPAILFCDEPGAGLDPITAAGIDRLLLTLNRSLGTTLVVVTHELLSIERLDGRLLMLDRGTVIFSGRVAEARVSDHPVVREFFHPGGVTPGRGAS
jgi:phospholipid/cholesterol/gamma-HCH transport system ATP-binding protein